MKKIITTVGTSLITNAIENEKVKPRAFKALKTKRYINTNDSELVKFVSSIKDDLSNIIHSSNENLSAEIASIIKIAKEKKEELEVYLIATDTILSPICAEYIKKWFVKHKLLHPQITIKSNPEIISKLRTEKPDSEKNNEDYFYEGFQNLIEKIIQLTKDDKENSILNITGGYKGIIPIITIIAQLEGLKLNYLFEDSDDLIEIGNLPFDFDWAIAEIYYQYLSDTDLRKKLDKESNIFINLRSLQLINEQKKLTIIGSLFSKYIDKHLPQRQGVLGYYMEHKLFYTFYQNKYKTEYRSELIGREFWWDKNDRTKYSIKPQYSKDKNKEERVEIDIQLTNSNDGKIWIEAKSYKGLSKAIKQMKKYIKFNTEAIHENLTELIIFIYKFDFQKLDKHKKNIENLKEYCNNKNIKFSLLYFDIPYNIEKNSINYNNIFNIELKEDFNLYKY